MGLRHAAVLVVAALTLSACGGDQVAAPEVTPTTEPAVPATPPAPDDLALVESEVRLEGDTSVLVQPGELVEIDHVLYNRAPTGRSITFRIRNADFDVTLPLSSLRVGSEETLHFRSTATIPASAEAGDVLTYDVLAAVSTDVDQRDSTTVELVVSDAAGERPVVGAHRGQTETNEKLTLYVLGAATDVDGDLDFASLRVVAGGFKSADLLANPDGTIEYLPFANITGEDRVLYELCDDEGLCDTNVITIDVSD